MHLTVTDLERSLAFYAGILGSPGTGQAAGAALPGAALFTRASCGACQTLKAAKAKGAVGPNLDKAKPSSALLIKQIPEPAPCCAPPAPGRCAGRFA